MNELDKKIFQKVAGINIDLAKTFAEKSDFTFEDYFSGEIELTKKLSGFFLKEITEVYSQGYLDGSDQDKGRELDVYLKSKYNIED